MRLEYSEATGIRGSSVDYPAQRRLSCDDLSGGIRALALISAVSTAATFAMTATTAGNLPWPNAAFELLGLIMIGAVVIAHARRLPAAQVAFVAGVILASVHSLTAAAYHWLDHWDDFMTWLPNATYIWRLGGFPTPAAPSVASELPGYPPGSSLVLAALWSLAGRVVDDTGPVVNVLALMVLPALTLRALDIGEWPSRLHAFALGVVLGLLATVLNVAMDWHWTLSSLPETATLVAFAVAFVLSDEVLFRKPTDARAQLAALAAILSLITNLKQTGIVLVGILIVATALSAWICRPADRRDGRDALIAVVLVSLPSIAVWLCWHIYLVEVFTAHAVSFRPLGQWYFSLLSDLIAAMGHVVVEYGLFFAPIAVVSARGGYVLVRCSGGGTAAGSGDRLSATFALAATAYFGFLVICYLGAFNDGEVRRAAEFTRYENEIGGAGTLVAIVLAVERLRWPRLIALTPVILTLQLVAVWMIGPADGIYQYGGVIPATEIETLRRLGREAGRLIERDNATRRVDMFVDAHTLATLVMRYQMWATAPLQITSANVVPVEGGNAAIAPLNKTMQHSVSAVALVDGSPRCGFYGDNDRAELLPTSRASPNCRSLLRGFDRAPAMRDFSGAVPRGSPP
jgi:hypothetical protein